MKKRIILVLIIITGLVNYTFSQTPLVAQLKKGQIQTSKEIYKSIIKWHGKKIAQQYNKCFIIYYLSIKNLDAKTYLETFIGEFKSSDSLIVAKIRECPTINNFELCNYCSKKGELAYKAFIYDDSLNIFAQYYQQYPYKLFKNTEIYEENKRMLKYLLALNAEIYFIVPEQPCIYYAWLNNKIHKIQYDSKTESVIENIIEKE